MTAHALTMQVRVSSCKFTTIQSPSVLSPSLCDTELVQLPSNMTCRTIHTHATLLYLIQLLLASFALSAQCNTNQNPYCAGNNQFEQLCCTYPNICYWSNRNGVPACCQAGSDCRGNGGPGPSSVVVFTAVQQTTAPTAYVVQTVYSTTPQYSTVTYYSTYSPPPATTTYVAVAPPVQTSFSTVVTPAVVVVTETQQTAAPVTTNGVYVTFTQTVNGASKHGADEVRWCWSGVLAALVVSLGTTFSI